MTQNNQIQGNTATGFLTVRVTTAGGAIPVENASVNIFPSDKEDSSVIFSLITNSDGITTTVPLPTPPRSASQTPQDTSQAYATYNISVSADGYTPAYFSNVPVFADIISVQPASLLPLLEDGIYYDPQIFDETNMGGGDYL